MALLQTQQNQEDENQTQQVQPQQQINQVKPAQPVQSSIPAQQAQVQPKQPVKKGTGFTNLGRVMQASRGSGLGQAVAGGITGQVASAQKGIETAQQRFEDQAQKARLDTEESAAKRADIVGRFDPSQYQVDESKFQVSEGLQSQYSTSKSGLQKELEAKKAASEQLLSGYQKEYGEVSDLYNKTMQFVNQRNALEKQISSLHEKPYVGGDLFSFRVPKVKAGKEAEVKALQDKLNSLSKVGTLYEKTDSRKWVESKALPHMPENIKVLKSIIDSTTQVSQAEQKEINDKLGRLEAEFGTMTEAEKQSFIESEKDRLIAEKAPTEQEIQDFTKYRTGTYTGPTELEDATSLLGKAAQTESLGQLARSSGGREELLKRFVGGKDYTSGQRRLDTAILGQERDSGISEAARQTRGTISDVQRANVAAEQKARELTGRAKEFGKETVRQLEEQASSPTAELDKRLEALRGTETKRTQDFGTYQSALAGTDPKYKGMDPLMRAGTVLQDAANKGYLDQAELTELMGAGGQTGLLQRAMNLGLDPSKMLAERLQDKQAQGLTRAGIASKEEAASLNALNQLLGRQPSELEFREGREQFTGGGIGLGASALRDYITKTEAERAQKDPKFAAQLEKVKPTYLQQAIGGTLGAIGGVEGTIGGVLGGDPSSIIAGAGQTALGNVQAMSAGKNAVLEGLLKFNVGGQSLSKTEAGKQLQKALEFQSMLENEALKMGGNVLNTGTESLSQLGRGNIADAMETLLAGGGATINQVGDLISRSDIGKVGGNIAREIGGFASNVASGFGAGETGHWSTDRLGTRDATTGKAVTYGSFANKSSADIAKQIQHEITQLGTAENYYDKSRHGYGAKRLGLLQTYYNNAKARENAQKQAQSAALQKFLTGNK